ncbi:MAG: hypothetical protein M3P37_10340 [Actinomycetota bacterium]|nr:hypothetical protein [Actinomycetota bacterium]
MKAYSRTLVLIFMLAVLAYNLTDGVRVGEVVLALLALAALVLAFLLDRRQVRRG